MDDHGNMLIKKIKKKKKKKRNSNTYADVLIFKNNIYIEEKVNNLKRTLPISILSYIYIYIYSYIIIYFFI